MRTTLQDVANTANVSITTVSRVLNKRGCDFISKDTANRVFQVARELGYRPNQAARAMATGRTDMIALWTAEVYPSFYSYTIHCLRQAIRRHNYELQIVETEAFMPTDHRIPSAMNWPVDGVILFENPWYFADYLHMANLSAPFVSMGVCVYDQFDRVAVDIYPGSKEAVEHLVRSGRKKIAFLVERLPLLDNEQRTRAYKDVMNAAGLEQEMIVFSKQERVFERKIARKTIIEYLDTHDHPDAIFCYNDESAIGVYRALRDLGLRVPDDVALIGCDGIEDSEYIDPPLSTIAPPIERMCEVASDYIHQRINEPDRELQQTTLKSEFIIRGSC